MKQLPKKLSDRILVGSIESRGFMKTKQRGRTKVMVEEFTIAQMKEYLMSVVQFSDNVNQLIRICNAAQSGQTFFNKKTQIFTIETVDKGEI